MKTWLLVGDNGCRALSANRRGTRLPARLGPWRLISPANFDHTADESLTALRSIQAKGYFLLGYADPELLFPQLPTESTLGLKNTAPASGLAPVRILKFQSRNLLSSLAAHVRSLVPPRAQAGLLTQSK